MWLTLSVLVAICIVFQVSSSHTGNLELIFRERSQSDWQDVWHKEKYTRCREMLVKHLYWACEKDVYRLSRRSEPRKVNYYYEKFDDENYGFPWLAPHKAKTFLRSRRGTNRRMGSSITSECCKSTGCTWEEYAEYCPTNKRYTTYI